MLNARSTADIIDSRELVGKFQKEEEYRTYMTCRTNNSLSCLLVGLCFVNVRIEYLVLQSLLLIIPERPQQKDKTGVTQHVFDDFT